MKFKKMVALMASAVLCVGMLTGCGSSSTVNISRNSEVVVHQVKK